jgi:hypothetical protein
MRCREIILTKGHLIEGNWEDKLLQAAAHFSYSSMLLESWADQGDGEAAQDVEVAHRIGGSDSSCTAPLGEPLAKAPVKPIEPRKLDGASNRPREKFPDDLPGYVDKMYEALVEKRETLIFYTEDMRNGFAGCLYRSNFLCCCVDLKLIAPTIDLESAAKKDLESAVDAATVPNVRARIEKKERDNRNLLIRQVCGIAFLILLLYILLEPLTVFYHCNSLHDLVQNNLACFNMTLAEDQFDQLRETEMERIRLVASGFGIMVAAWLLVLAFGVLSTILAKFAKSWIWAFGQCSELCCCAAETKSGTERAASCCI